MKKILLLIPIALLIMCLYGCTGEAAPTPDTATRAASEGNSTPTLSARPTHSRFDEMLPTEQPLVQRIEETRQPTPQAPTKTPNGEPSRTPLPTLKPDEWKDLPIIPSVSESVIHFYRRGIELGNRPNAFSKIGDCGSTPAWFLGDFDRGPSYYRLGEYTNLEAVIDHFQGSFDRTSLAARSGFNVSALFTPLWSDRAYCGAGEAPLECEYRVHRPVIAFITLGANDVWRPDEFEPQLRRTIEFSLQQGVIPILATKADNQEGDGSINATIARLAREYDLPLWNYWAAVSSLPNNGLQEDEAHLTWGRNMFDNPETMKKAWPVRNLTALQVLNAVWQKISSVDAENGS